MDNESTIEGKALRRRLERDRDATIRAASELAAQTDRPADVSSPELRQADAEFEAACERLELLDRRLSQLPSIEAVWEPDMYMRGGSRSFFADLVASAEGIPVHGVDPIEARDRLKRHSQYEETRHARSRRVAEHDLGRFGIQARGADRAVQQRAVSTSTAPGIVPPTWLVEQWATVARAACPLRKLVTKLPLPENTLELHIPRFRTGAGVVPMVAENINAPDGFNETDELVTHVATFAGDGAVSEQLYSRGGRFSDEIAVAEFGAAYSESLAQQLMAGTGENAQLLGLLNVAGAGVTTYTSSEPTPAGIVKVVAAAAGTMSDTRLRAPSVILMRGARWFALAGTPDQNDEPVVRPGTGTVPGDSDTGPYGPLLNLPVYHDNAGIPADLGSGGNQDAIVLVHASDVLLLEEPYPRFSAFPATNQAGGMIVVLQWHTYAASFPNRYPSGIGQVRGTGLTVPAGF
jgi:HK97 family phage major capsid protein